MSPSPYCFQLSEKEPFSDLTLLISEVIFQSLASRQIHAYVDEIPVSFPSGDFPPQITIKIISTLCESLRCASPVIGPLYTLTHSSLSCDKGCCHHSY